MPELVPQEPRKVQIGGETFHLRSDGSGDEVDEIAGYVDFHFQKAQKAAGAGDRFRAAILAALNVAGDLWDVKKIREELEEERRRLQQRLDELLEKTTPDTNRDESEKEDQE